MEKTLVILAAGMGSRFGGLKQIEPFGPNNEFIIDYSIYDAIRNGFNKVVFIIKRENLSIFKETIGKRVEDKIPTYYAFQDMMTFVPENIKMPDDRVKPLGTGQAILAVKEYVNEPFVVINADDFYGYDAFLKAKEFFDNNTDTNVYANISYKVVNTVTENGSVKRGIAKEKDGYLTEILESKVEKIDNKLVAKPLSGGDSFDIEDDLLVSMNMFCFYPNLFKYLEDGFIEFLNDDKTNLESDEYLLPNLISQRIKTGDIKVKIVKTTACWHGVTYKEDKDFVVKSIKKLIDDGLYPNNLWK